MTVYEWFEQYKEKSGARYETYLKAFEEFNKRDGGVIVETGCIRFPDDWGAGMSTYLFGEYLENFGGHLWTVDISLENMECCKKVTKQFTPYITYSVNDSQEFLRTFDKLIDFLYLDSMDCPLVDNPEDPELIKSQTHQLNEAAIAVPKMSDHGIILLDDNGFENGGKTRLTKVYLKEHGWKELLGKSQSLWTR